jgi:hypothetical protein
MSTVDTRRRALRGTKRTCQACEVRFYDLGRDRIACPMCGVDYTPPAEPAVATTARAPFSQKTGWHRQPLRRLPPALPVSEAMLSDRIATAAAGEQTEATGDAEDSGVPEEHDDDTDVADLVEAADSHENEPL